MKMNLLTTQQIFIESARKCCANAERLLSDAQMVEFEKPKATHYFLSVIAQEETAKAFLLYLVSIEAITWTPFLLRATRDHHCKQLVGIVLDYLAPDFDKWMREMELSKTQRKFPTFPKTVADALNILYHEKIRRWENDCWFWAEDPEYDKFAQQVADGVRDKAKQRGLYVDIGRNGQVASLPTLIKNKQADEEFERAKRYQRCVQGLLDGSSQPLHFEQIAGYFKGMFTQNFFIES
jgi:AbiV family abortive infection protein